jgi:hypothetical protein
MNVEDIYHEVVEREREAIEIALLEEYLENLKK